jgi:prophage DNA circulation protein
MSWDKTLHPASFGDLTFEVVSTTDRIERDLISSEIPYVDGANVEDSGRKGGLPAMLAVFSGDDYENRLQAFRELIHPVFGPIRARFWRAEIQHTAEEPDRAHVSLEFMEDNVRAPLFNRILPVQHVEAVNQAADDALAAARAGYQVDIKNALNLPGALRDKLSADMLGAIDTMHGYADQLVEARGWLASGMNYLENPEAFVDDVAGGLVSRVTALYSSGSSLLGSSGGTSGYTRTSLGPAWHEPVAHLQQPLVPASVAPNQSSPLTVDASAVQPFLVAHLAVQQSLAIAGAAAQLYAAELDASALTPADVENVATDTRATINDAIALVRQIYPDIVQSRPITEALKAVALGVTTAAEKLIHAKPMLLERLVETPGNLQLLAHLWYGDYRRADELLRLNPQVRNPNLIARGAILRAYAT